jgi:D-ribose pyranose/furanose isomerase RbsD
MKNKFICALTLLMLMAATTAFAAENWKDKLHRELPRLGHRNWIVVADAAYPLQTAPGIETICADAEQATVVKEVLAALAKTKHVQPAVFTDTEMKYVAEKNAMGISKYRETLAKILADKNVQALPHEQIIGKLDEAGKTFKVLLIKTPLTLPYTSVFFQLECGYWNAGAEKELRDAMKTVK